jgi:alkylated DNA repair dioxygenase AlkB
MCDLQTANDFLFNLLDNLSNNNLNVPSITYSLDFFKQQSLNNLKCPLDEKLFKQVLNDFNSQIVKNKLKIPIIIVNEEKVQEEPIILELIEEFFLWPKSISEFFYLRPDEKEYFPNHGKFMDTCTEYYARDLETGRCLLIDKLPVGSFLRYKGELIAGSGKNLLLHLKTHEGSWENVKNFLKKPKSEKEIIDNSKYTSISVPVFSNVTSWNGISYFMKNWPNGLLFIPDFMTNKEQQILFDKINKLSWEQTDVIPFTKKIDRDVIQYGYIYDFGIKTSNIVKLTKVNEPPEFISCIINLIKKYAKQMGINNDFNPNQIIITKLKPGQGTVPVKVHPLFETFTIRLSLGSNILFNLISDEKEIISIPLQPGSLLIMDNETRKYKQEIPKTTKDTYTMPFITPETISWNRTDYISIQFNTIKPEAIGEDKSKK